MLDLVDTIPDLDASVADELDEDALIVIWGTGREAKRLAAELVERGKRATVFDRTEGVGALVELVHGAAT